MKACKFWMHSVHAGNWALDLSQWSHTQLCYSELVEKVNSSYKRILKWGCRLGIWKIQLNKMNPKFVEIKFKVFWSLSRCENLSYFCKYKQIISIELGMNECTTISASVGFSLVKFNLTNSLSTPLFLLVHNIIKMLW